MANIAQELYAASHMTDMVRQFAAAVKRRDLRGVQELLRQCPELVNSVLHTSGERALHMAAEAGDIAMVASLLSAGAEVNAVTAFDYTALDVAYRRDYKEIAELLVAHGGESYA